MLVDEMSTRESLVRMVRKLTANRALKDDLLQEALIHLWVTEIGRPGQTKSWYLQSCKYHLLHYLAAGRSIDSAKRRNGQTPVEEHTRTDREFAHEVESAESVFGLVSARDILSLLSPLLNQQERSVLECFADGLRLREIGRRLNISHTMVIRHRLKIATLFRKLETPRHPAAWVNGHPAGRMPKANKFLRKSKPSPPVSFPGSFLEVGVRTFPEQHPQRIEALVGDCS